LTCGKFAIVDLEDYDLLSRDKWCAVKDSNTYYAVRSRQNKQIRMHREIMKVPKHLYFNNEIDAAKAYDKKARELFKEFACLNFTHDV